MVPSWSAIPLLMMLTAGIAGWSVPLSPTTVNSPDAPGIAGIAPEAASVMRWYRQTVHDPGGRRLGEIDDLLVDREGRIVAVIIGIGPPGMSSKHVAVAFRSIRVVLSENDRQSLTLDATIDDLAATAGYDYDSNAMTWVPERQPTTTGRNPRP